ncbi:hypothetical protein T484DRAFT_1816217 [Baffinella frigidus]|nr:hypothetical protein T484DRAFT_1816217 [Cryptophyta sp. CCMP2293]
MGSCRIYAPLLVLSLALAPSLSSAFAPITANTLRIMSRRAASAALSPPNVKRIRGGGAHALNMATLYCKQGEKEGSMGECPFTLKANMALRSKKVDFE